MRLRHRRSVLPPTVVRRRSGSSGAGTFAPAPSLAVPLAGLPVIGEAAAEAVGAALGGDGAPAAPQQQQQQQQQQDGGSPASADPPSSPFAQALSAPLPHDAPPPAIGSTGELARSSGHGLQLREPAGGSGEHSWKGFGSAVSGAVEGGGGGGGRSLLDRKGSWWRQLYRPKSLQWQDYRIAGQAGRQAGDAYATGLPTVIVLPATSTHPDPPPCGPAAPAAAACAGQLPPGCKPVLVFINTKSGPQVLSCCCCTP